MMSTDITQNIEINNISFKLDGESVPGPSCYVLKSLYYKFMNMKYRDLFNIHHEKNITNLQVKDVLGNQYESVKQNIEDVLNGKNVVYELDLGFEILQIHYTPDYLIKNDKTSEIIGFFMMGLDVTTLRKTQINYKNDLLIEVEKKTKILSEAVENLKNTKKELEETNEELNVTIESLKNTQERLIESEKMASLGGLVSGVAHEINTPIGIGITGITYLLEITNEMESKYKKDEMSQDDLEVYFETSKDLGTRINSSLVKTAELVRSFKQIAFDQRNEEKREINLKNYIHIVIISMRNILKNNNIYIKIKGDNDLIIYTYPSAISLIVQNLVMNAVKHGYKEKEKGIISINLEKKEDNVKIVFNNDGEKIEKKNIKKIFEPFFTTNRTGGGKGLGLNIVYNIVTSILKGSIICASNTNSGVEFTINFKVDKTFK